ncbi:2-iminoacetate synthase ThiH [Chitinivibrio alkaliphilus]|uniref:Thiazole biosynthesis protein ThiH n=1 Tax=Chitinivibrio alkaliphilus ACht1 TaxID=1313304 RepID=U7DEA7_9BACT|nr:2-iminoacetate synthase ThiH [Chitinivibrio alkaliphilus]ERP39256.1 thiazole biosynthesis protein ThiH [Chitinivibrio alkaliphilus ACht1]
MSLQSLLASWYERPFSEKKISFDAALGARSFSMDALQTLLSRDAATHLEEMAQEAKKRTEQHFGKAVTLFTPLYVSNYCTNGCRYCAFQRDNHIRRRQLSPEEIERAGDEIAATGMRHLLVLTGEAPRITTFAYLEKCLSILAPRFSSLSLEVYPMKEHEYARLVEQVQLEGVTVYQETYNRSVYAAMHPFGEKREYDWRLETVDRAARAGVRSVTVGSLLGLDEPRTELGALALHLDYITKTYPGVAPVVSFPRLRPIAGSSFPVPYPVDDAFFVQIVLAFRILFPHVGITMSTREERHIRNGLVPLGVTKMSAGVSTAVEAGEETTEGQFEIADDRSLDAVCVWLQKEGFQPVLHDWNRCFTTDK